MRIKRSQLRSLIESFLVEEDNESDKEAEEGSEKEESEEASIDVSKEFKTSNHKFVISINDKTGVDVKIIPFDKSENENEFNIKHDDPDVKVKHEKLSNILAGIGIANKDKSSAVLNDIQTVIDAARYYLESLGNEKLSLSNDTFRTHVVRFDSEFA